MSEPDAPDPAAGGEIPGNVPAENAASAEGPSVTRTVTICNRRGLHARAAARFVKLAWQFDAEVMVAKNGTSVSGRSIMGLMMLAAGPGTTIALSATGREAERAVAALADLVCGGFDEE